MAIMKSCCCFSNMKSACLASGAYTIVMATLTLLGILTWHYKLIYYFGDYCAIFILVVIVIAYMVLVLGGILLIAGLSKGYSGRPFILAFVVIVFIYVLLFAIGVILICVLLNNQNLRLYISVVTPIVIIGVVKLIFFILGLLSAISLYQLLGEEGPNGPLSQEPPPSTKVTTHAGSAYPVAVQSPNIYPVAGLKTMEKSAI